MGCLIMKIHLYYDYGLLVVLCDDDSVLFASKYYIRP